MYKHRISNNTTAYNWLAILGILAGLLHLLIVSLMHRENFVELWYFTFTGATQLFLGLYIYLHPKNRTVLNGMIILHGGMIVLWVLTRLFDAPFAAYPEAIGFFDSLIAIIELVAFGIGYKLLNSSNPQTTKNPFAIILITLLFGFVNYGIAKGAENVFKSIPISEQPHRHSLKEMFVAPQKIQPKADKKMGETQPNEPSEVFVPEGHDNSDGHHG
jgi:hypothetical protein